MAFTLGDGAQMPQIGFGTFQIKDEDAEEPVTAALRIGYRHLDTAEMYNNSQAVGRALAASGVPREDVFITTKVCSTHSVAGT